MTRSAWRALRTELLRGTAPIAAATFAVAGSAMLFNDTEAWAGRWAPLAESSRVILIVLVPMAIAAGAWQAGRERRRRIGEQLTATARPGWQPVLVAWVAVTLGTFAGYLLVWLSGAVLVAPIATYGGRTWWLTLAVGFVGLAAASALGVAIGRLIPGRVVAPLAGVLSYVVFGVLSLSNASGLMWLAPALSSPRSGTHYLAPTFQLVQVAWLGALAATFVLVATARRKWLAVVPAALALTVAVPIVNGPGYDRWQPDPVAQELVCAEGDGPDVCLARVNAFLLDDVTGPVREQLARWDGVPGGYFRLIDAMSLDMRWQPPPPEGTAVIHLENLISWNGGLSDLTEYGDTIENQIARTTTAVTWDACGTLEPPRAELGARSVAEDAALRWAGADLDRVARGEVPPVPVDQENDAETSPFERLRAMPEADQLEWMGRYLEAARTCDDDAFTELAEALR